MASHIGGSKRKRKPSAATAGPEAPFRRGIRGPIRPPAIKSSAPAAHVVILSYALTMAGPGIDPGERVKFRLLRPRQPCLRLLSARLAAPVALASSRQAEVADASTHHLCVRRAAHPAEPVGSGCVRCDSGRADGGRPQLSWHFGPPARAERIADHA